MALTRNLLKSIGLTEEQISTTIENHMETVDALKAERDRYKADAEKVEGLTAQLSEANDKLSKSGDADKVRAEFDAYKDTIVKEKTEKAKRKAVDAVLLRAGVQRASFRELILKTMDMDEVELDENEEVKDASALENKIKSNCADFISTTSTSGTPKTEPPTGGGKEKDPFEQGFDE